MFVRAVIAYPCLVTTCPAMPGAPDEAADDHARVEDVAEQRSRVSRLIDDHDYRSLADLPPPVDTLPSHTSDGCCYLASLRERG